MRICALSPFATASKDDILSFLQYTRADCVVLPGLSANTPSVQDIQSVLAAGVEVSLEQKTATLSRCPMFVTRDDVKEMPEQVFWHKPTRKKMKDLAEIWPLRKKVIAGREITALICGEVNGFDVRAAAKFGQDLPFDILINPTHTMMGHWNHLGKKLSALSQRRVVIHVANNNRSHARVSTDIRVYVDEKLLRETTILPSKLKACEIEL